MGERKGQNKYYPPDFNYKKHSSLNAYHGTHALRERARKLDRGILIIRFEMPYNIWCDGCKAHVAMGVRYNAEKTKVDMYLSTPIYQFRMKCHLCDTYFIIKTDPQNKDYVILSGARRKEQRWSMQENEQIVTQEKEDIKRLKNDPMFKLEHDTKDKEKLKAIAPTIVELEHSKLKWKDDYALNSFARDKFRNTKKQINEEKAKEKAFCDKWNINIKLVKEHEDDIKLASLLKYSIKSDDTQIGNEKRKIIQEESIFTQAKKKKDPSKVSNLREKLTKSIQQNKLQEISSDRSLLFDLQPTSSLEKQDEIHNKSLVSIDYNEEDTN